jgi:hypothetical protein
MGHCNKPVHIIVCLHLNGFCHRAVFISRSACVKFLFESLDEERSYKRRVDTVDEMFVCILFCFVARRKKREDKLRHE